VALHGQRVDWRQIGEEVSRMLHPQGQQFHIRIEQDGRVARLHLIGEMDVACEEPFDRAVRGCLDHGPTDLLVDLTHLTFIDSSGLRTLIKLWRELRDDGVDLSILQGTGQVRTTMEIAGVGSFLPIVDQESSPL
jgi:anti-sigma B factor antagonist